jgi:hypothetical protein
MGSEHHASRGTSMPSAQTACSLSALNWAPARVGRRTFTGLLNSAAHVAYRHQHSSPKPRAQAKRRQP